MDNDIPKYFDSLMKLYIHQNDLMWSRTKTLLAIESAALYVGYGLKTVLAGPLFILFGSIFLASILVIYHRDKKYRDVICDLLIETGGPFFTEARPKLHKTFGFLTGVRIFYGISCFMIMVNLALLFYFLINILQSGNINFL
ncbi:MAG: hypothetical protein AB1424_02630 [Thermodesulfobacteriota bacterium]